MSIPDVVYCLNLNRRPDRWSMFSQRIPDEWDLPEIKRVAAVDGRGLACDGRVTPGTLGCLATHRAMLEQVVRKARVALVFEDDVIFRAEFCRNFAALLRSMPDDWDMIYLGGEHKRTPTYIAPGVLRCTWTTRTHAYLVRPDAAVKLLRGLAGWESHVDHAFGQMQADGMVLAYAPERWLCGQSAGTSDVHGFNQPGRVVENYFDYEEAIPCLSR